MNAYVLMVQWKDDEPIVAGVFSSFERAVRYFVRTNYADSGFDSPELRSVCARAALKLAHETEDEDFSEFGPTRAWIEEAEVDGECEHFEMEERDDC